MVVLETDFSGGSFKGLGTEGPYVGLVLPVVVGLAVDIVRLPP